MCEIFPEFNSCCLLLSLRIGMLLISVLAIITGSISLSVIEQQSDASYENLKNVTTIRDTNRAISELSHLINSGLTFMAVCFMFTGVLLLFANLGDSEGFVQIFIWGVFFNVMFGFIMVLAICFECIFKENSCLLRNMDWLSASALLVLVVIYLFAWIYYASIANSYVLQHSP